MVWLPLLLLLLLPLYTRQLERIVVRPTTVSAVLHISTQCDDDDDDGQAVDYGNAEQPPSFSSLEQKKNTATQKESTTLEQEMQYTSIDGNIITLWSSAKKKKKWSHCVRGPYARAV